MPQDCIDTTPRIVLSKPKLDDLKRARRWLRGCAELLDRASNGDEFVDKIARESALLATMAEIAIADQESVTHGNIDETRS